MPLVAGAPFHAKVTSEYVRLLADGTTVSEKSYDVAARDGAGRLYREDRGVVAANSDREPPLLRTIVYDPRTSLSTICNLARSTCRLANFNPELHPVEEPVGLSPDGTSTLTRESLGKRKVDGLEVQGTRETRLFKAGSQGNNRAIVTTTELWYSPQLQVNLEITRDDPRSGKQHFLVTELKLGEPGPDWFAVPNGYRLVEDRPATQASVAGHSRVGPHSLEPLIEKEVSQLTPEQLTAALQPVDAAVDAYAQAHSQAWPNDKNQYFADQMRQQLAMDLRSMQRNRVPTRDNFEAADLRLNQAFRAAIESPCLNKSIPGDPPDVPTGEADLRAEQAAWVKVRDAWSSFLATLFPAGSDMGFGIMLTNQRQSEFRRLQVIERNRGCLAQDER
jgi:uncharacterized protein YecT (DUF1311 family)